jgi:sugar lactone lactonase YvrE/ribosomal protein S11
MSKNSIDPLRAAFIVMLLADLTACGGNDGASTYTVGGTVSGLAAGSSITLTDGGSDALTVSTNGAFTFKTPLAAGASYAAAISAAPAMQVCTVTNGTGKVSSAAVSSIRVICVGPYTVGGTISGLAAGSTIVLTDNGGDSDSVSSNGTFTFPTALKGGSAYAVAIATQPALQTCTVQNGSGDIGAASVSTVSINCVGPFSVGGQVSGLSPNTSLTITDNGADALTISANGSFTFSTSLKPGASYAAAISVLPSGEQCGLTGSTGVVAASNYTGMSITCAIPTLSLVAGALGGSGSIDGNRTTARLYYPGDVVADAAGNLYVADDYNALVRKIDVSGNVTTLAGKARQMGTADGTGAAARFNNPISVAVDPNGNIYVVDGGVNTIREISPSGVVTTLAGTPLVYGTADGTGPSAKFKNPGNIRWASAGSLYLTDDVSIRNITPAGVVTTVYTGTGQLAGLDVSQPGIVLATDVTNKIAVKINLIAHTATTIATGFKNPVGIVLAAPSSSLAGTTYVADEFAATLDAISTTGILSTLAGTPGVSGYADGTGSAAQFYIPTYMSLNGAGNILIADMGANTIRQATPAGVVATIAGTPIQAGSADGATSTARFNNPGMLVADAAGNLYVGDSNGIREVTTTGQVSTPFAEGGVTGLAPDGKGNFYFTRIPNNSIQRIAPDGTVSVMAGSQNAGFADGTGAAAGFNQPHGVAVDSLGNLFVADTGNATIRMITPAGVVTTLAGNPGAKGSADGTGANASFTSPVGIAVDSNDTLFVTDGNAIRTVTSRGAVTTLAGSQTYGSSDGTGAAAQFNGPGGIAIGSNGKIFVSDSGNSTIREISATGVVTTLVGIAGEAGVKLGPLPTTLNVPAGLAYVGSTLYVVDEGENSVLSISGVF